MYELDLCDPETWPSVLTPRECADMARVTPRYIRDLIDNSELKAVNVGVTKTRYRIPKEAWEDFLERSRRKRASGEQHNAEHLVERKRRRQATAAAEAKN